MVQADIDGDAVAATRDEIIAAGGDCTNVVGDRDRDSAADVTETALAVADSRVDILVNNVGDFPQRA